MSDASLDIELGQEILQSLQSLNELFEGLQTRVKGVEDVAEKSFKKVQNTLDFISFNAINEGLENLSSSLDFTQEIGTLKTDIQRLTGETGEALKATTKESYRLAEVWDQDAMEITRAANTMTNTIGGSMADNLKLIEQGLEKGVNANGDMFRQIQEYAPFWKQLGLDGSEAFALISQASSKGVFDDKAMDAMKEANLSLREMGQAQVDALAGIGISVEDVAGKTSFEVIQMISTAMKTADTQARQLVLADIFKGAGEDAGLAFIEGLDTMDLSLENIPSVSTFGTSFTSWLAGIKVEIFEFAGDTVAYLQPITDLTRTFNTFMPVLKGVGNLFSWLGKTKLVTAAATKIATAAQWLFNIALNANPLGALLIAVTAVTAAVAIFSTTMKGASAVEKANTEIKERAMVKSADERVELALLMDQLKKTTAETEERRVVAEKLNQLYPETLKNYDLEKASLEDIAKAERDIIKEIDNRARAEAAREMLKEDYQTIMDHEMKYKNGYKGRATDALGTKELYEYTKSLESYTEAFGRKKYLLKEAGKYNEETGALPPESTGGDGGDGGDGGGDGNTLGFGNKNLFASKAAANHQMKSLEVNIATLVGTINITQSNRAQTVSDIRQQVSEALVGAVRDFETSM